jgi:fatty-acyl-CoA synthase
VKQAIVYGVTVGGTDGRAGMATLVAGDDLNLPAFRTHLIDRLPGYARPLFLRVRNTIDVTSTFKHTKADFARQGWDPVAIPDAMYFNDAERGMFVPLDPGLYDRINTGQIRI